MRAARAAAETSRHRDTELQHRVVLARAEIAMLADDREQSYELYRQALGWELTDIERSNVLFSLGNVSYGLHSASAAADWHRQALHLRQATYGDSHPLVGASLSALGRVLKSEDLDEATRALDRAVRIEERVYGPDGLPVAKTLSRKASVLLRQDESAAALELLERAASIVKRNEGRTEYDTVLVWTRLGSALSAQGRHDEALAAHQAAYDRLVKAFGPGYPRLVVPALNYAHAAARAGRPQDAVQWFERALELLPRRASRTKQRAVLRFELAKNLWAAGLDRPRAIAEAKAARAMFQPGERSTTASTSPRSTTGSAPATLRTSLPVPPTPSSSPVRRHTARCDQFAHARRPEWHRSQRRCVHATEPKAYPPTNQSPDHGVHGDAAVRGCLRQRRCGRGA